MHMLPLLSVLTICVVALNCIEPGKARPERRGRARDASSWVETAKGSFACEGMSPHFMTERSRTGFLQRWRMTGTC
jgi:hypothetical protein